MTKISITGASGLVGSHFLEYVLQNTDWQVVCISSFRHSGKTDRISEIIAGNVEWSGRVAIEIHDLTVPFSEQLIEKIGSVDYIANFASESHVPRSIADPVPFIRNNVDLMLSVLEYARIAKPKVFYHMSSDEVFGDTDGKPHAVWDTLLPSSPYSCSKAMQEQLCLAYWRTYDVPVVILSSMNMFGERQASEKYIPMCIKKILNGEKITVHGTLNNMGSRYYIHAKDVASAVVYLLQNVPTVHFDSSHNKPLRYNIAGEVEVSNLEIAQMIAEALEKPLEYELVDPNIERPGHDFRYSLDMTALKDTGWASSSNFKTDLSETVQWTANNRRWL